MTYDDDERGWRWFRNIGVSLVFVVLLAAGFWLVQSDDGGTARVDLTTVRSPAIPVSADSSDGDATSAPVGLVAPSAGSFDEPIVPVSASTTTTATSGSTSATTAPSQGDERTDVAQAGPTPVAERPGATSTSTTSTGSAPTSPAMQGPTSYPTSPDGAPLPIVAVFDGPTITLTGFVPSEEARDRLVALAVANSKTAAEVVDNMIVDASVPIGVGVRVIEMSSARFPEGSTRILPAHAAELDRVVTIMEALPNVSVLVVGHADQRGAEGDNLTISDERARAVVNYLRFLGIAPTRVASRAAGESDLLTLDDDAAALALNRRTEFVFFGLLV